MNMKWLIALLAVMTLAGNCLAQSGNGIIVDLEAKAQANDAYAQAVLGRHYLDGYLVEKDDQKASELFWASARQKHPLGMYGVADMVNSGRGGNAKDAEKAKPLFQAVLKALEPLAASGDAYAENALGEIYDYAKGTEKNYSEAVKWYEMAAEQGLAISQYNLAYMYDSGDGVETNVAKAISLFQQSAEHGYINGYYAIGGMHRDGRGVETNLVEAVKWFRKGAEAGDPKAQDWLGAFYRDGKGVDQDYAQAAKWFRKAATQGYASAQNNLGSLYRDGNGVDQDYAQALKLFRKAAEQGNASAQNALGTMYVLGKGVEQNDIESVKWVQKAADQGLAVAQFNMGSKYENGRGVTQSNAEALKWYQLAAAQGRKDAQEKVTLLSAPINDEEAEKNASIKVKGLFIGMDIRRVTAILKEKLAGQDWGISEVAKGDAGRFGGLTSAENYYVAVGGRMPVGMIVAGPDLKVISINIGGMLANDMFNAADMEATAFAQQFAEAYAIPEMKVADDMQSYVYTSPDGVQVRIDSEKTVVITKVASVQERKKAFD